MPTGARNRAPGVAFNTIPIAGETLRHHFCQPWEESSANRQIRCGGVEEGDATIT